MLTGTFFATAAVFGRYNRCMSRYGANSAFADLVEQLSKLPGIGQRSSERIIFHLLRQSKDEVLALSDAIRRFKQDLKACRVCGNVTESDPCTICEDMRRENTILIVEQPSDILSIEQSGAYRGRYHVLMGRIAPMENLHPGELNIAPLLDRIREQDVSEVIIATSATLEGDGTAMYLADQLSKLGIKVTRLARGMPAGSDLKLLSKAVLSDAIQGRNDF